MDWCISMGYQPCFSKCTVAAAQPYGYRHGSHGCLHESSRSKRDVFPEFTRDGHKIEIPELTLPSWHDQLGPSQDWSDGFLYWSKSCDDFLWWSEERHSKTTPWSHQRNDADAPGFSHWQVLCSSSMALGFAARKWPWTFCKVALLVPRAFGVGPRIGWPPPAWGSLQRIYMFFFSLDYKL